MVRFPVQQVVAPIGAKHQIDGAGEIALNGAETQWRQVMALVAQEGVDRVGGERPARQRETQLALDIGRPQRRQPQRRGIRAVEHRAR